MAQAAEVILHSEGVTAEGGMGRFTGKAAGLHSSDGALVFGVDLGHHLARPPVEKGGAELTRGRGRRHLPSRAVCVRFMPLLGAFSGPHLRFEFIIAPGLALSRGEC